MVRVRKFSMRYKKTILTIMVVMFVSCGGGSGTGTDTSSGKIIPKVLSTVISDSAAVTMIPVGY